jgi:flavin-dependent dehydrogenase
MFDAIVVGAPCGGAPTAMLLARQGHRVLLLDRVLASNCPPIRQLGLDLGDFQLTGGLMPADGVAFGCAPRRTVLDELLVTAAAEAGAEVREGFAATGLTMSDGRVTGIRGHDRDGAEIEEAARIVIGADGRNSLVARSVAAAKYNVRPPLCCGFYAYWQAPPHPAAIHPLPRRVVITFPTNDGLTVSYVACPREDFNHCDLDRYVADTVGQVAALEEPFRAAARDGRVRGLRDIPNFFRQSYGDGWALVGDAGYHKDPILAQGISDAFRSAEWLAEAVQSGFSGARSMSEVLAEYQCRRDEHLMPMYDLSCMMAALQPPPPEMLALYRALRGNATECDRFFGTLGGTVPVAEYYAPENMQRIIAGAA